MAAALQQPMLGGRGLKMGRLDDLGSGGRLSRRTTDPLAEAERRMQQDKLYSLDLEKVLAGESPACCGALNDLSLACAVRLAACGLRCTGISGGGPSVNLVVHA